MTTIFTAIKSKNKELLVHILNTNPKSIYEIDISYHDFTPLHWAAEIGNLDFIHTLILYGANIKLTNSLGHTPRDNGSIIHIHLKNHFNALDYKFIHDAIKSKNLTLAQSLFWSGANVNAIDNYYHNFTALHWATQLGDSEMIKWLLSAGANGYAINNLGYSPYKIATVLHPNIASLLPKSANEIKKEAKTARNLKRVKKQIRYQLGINKKQQHLLFG